MTEQYEVEIAPGLRDVVCDELRECLGSQLNMLGFPREDAIAFTYSGNPAPLLGLQTVIAVYTVQSFPIPRPKAFLGHQHFHALIDQLRATMAISETDSFGSLYLSAAGSNSSVMKRLIRELSQHLNIKLAADMGDLLLRLRPTPGKKRSWDALVRITSRPLATRDWRLCNMEGALNASVAHSMVRMMPSVTDGSILNIGCGSGTFLIEHLNRFSNQQIMGLDVDSAALNCARENIQQAGVADSAHLMLADALRLPFPDETMTTLYADLPFGQLVGSHQDNLRLYPALLQEAGRVAKHGAHFGIITHEIQLMTDVLHAQSTWHSQQERKITLSGLHPRIYILEKS